MPSGFFISLEGGEGAGKSTQAALLARRLGDVGIQCILVHEPGTTVLGTYLRDYIKSTRPLSKESELLLFEAARAQLVSEIIKPSLKDGITVVSDRFEASSVAYQGYGRRISVEAVHRLNEFAVQGALPDLTLLLDIEPEERLRRAGGQLVLQMELNDADSPVRQDPDENRRFEDLSLGFHTRVRDGFLRLAKEKPERWVVINGSLTVDGVQEEIWRHVAAKFPWPSVSGEPPVKDPPAQTNQPLL